MTQNSNSPISQFIVDSFEDVIDSNDGLTTLREAINAANNTTGQDAISFNLATDSTIQLGGQLDITDDLIINGLGAGNLTISGEASFDNFFIKNADVVIDGLTIANGEDGITIGGDSNLTLTNSILSNNANDGIDINGNNNSITLSGVSVTGNGDNGVEVDATNSTINISNSSFVKNGTDGLNFDEGGNNIVSVSSSSFSNNTGDGIDVNSDGNSFNLSSVALTNNGEDGLEIDGNNNIVTANNSSFNNNTSDGFNIDEGGNNTVSLSNISLNNNTGDGIDIVTTNNNINLVNFSVSGNLEDGVEIDGGFNTLTASNGSFTNNTGDGVDFNGSNNTVSLSGIGISGNGEDGIEISPGSNDNTLTVTNAGITANTGDGIDVNGNSNTVTVSGTSLSGNGVGTTLELEDGFEVDGNNNQISISNSSLNDNLGDGFNIDSGSSNRVNLSGVELANNTGDGIDIVTTNNNINLVNFSVSGNLEDGVEIDGGFNTLTASNGSFTNNTGDGVDFNGDNNTASLSFVSITGNGEDGVEISPGSDGNTLTVSNGTVSNNAGQAIANRGNANTVNVFASTIIDSLPVISVSAEPTNVLEGGQLKWNFNLSNAATSPLVVKLDLTRDTDPLPGDINYFVDGSKNITNFELVRNADGTINNALVTIATGAKEATLLSNVIADGIVEGPESITFSLVSGNGYSVDPTVNNASFTIIDVPVITTLLNTSAGDIGSIDPVSGVFTPLFTGGSAWGDIALSPINGQLFADTTSDAISLGETNPDKLFGIDTTTGKSTLIGDLGVTNLFGLEFGSNGVLYGTSEAGGFYSINTNTGATKLIADIPGFSAAGDIAFNSATQEFLATSTTPDNTTLFAISTNGAARVVGDIGFTDVLGVQFDDGKLLGYTRGGNQIEIDPDTGTGTFIQGVKGLTGQVLGATAPIALDFNTVSLANTSGGEIGVLDPVSGAFTPLFTGGSAWGDIALSPINGQLFADTTSDAISLGETNPDKLFRIDTTTGKSTLIGDLGVTNLLGLEFGSNGVLYGTSQAGGFYSIDTNTGAAKLIADIPGFSAAGDLVFNTLSQEFLATSTSPDNTTLFAITTNGAARVVGDIGFADVLGVQFDGGKLLGYTRNGSEIEINSTTGVGTLIQEVTGLTGQVLGVTSIEQLSPIASGSTNSYLLSELGSNSSNLNTNLPIASSSSSLLG